MNEPTTRPPAPHAVRPATAADVPDCAGLYVRGFEKGLRALFGRLPERALLEELLTIYLEEEPEGFLVWADAERADGYLLVTRSLDRLMRRALLPRHVVRAAWGLVRGRYGIARPGTLAHAIREVGRFRDVAGDFRTSGDAQIVSIAVREGARGTGGGRRLMLAGLGYLERAAVREVRLEVQPDNDSAQRLYQTLGFTLRGEIPSPLGRALVMTSPVPARPTAG